MKTIYLDIMIGERFFRQIPYEYSPLFKLNFEDVMKYIYSKFPSLKNERDVRIASGNKVFNK